MQSVVITILLVGLFGLLAYRQRGAIGIPIREKLARMFWHYTWGCFSTGVNGAALAVKGTLGVAAGAAFNPQAIQAPNWEMALYIFAVAFALNALDWFTKNPLPTDLVETTTTTATTIETETRTDTVAKTATPPIQP